MDNVFVSSDTDQMFLCWVKHADVSLKGSGLPGL